MGRAPRCERPKLDASRARVLIAIVASRSGVGVAMPLRLVPAVSFQLPFVQALLVGLKQYETRQDVSSWSSLEYPNGVAVVAVVQSPKQWPANKLKPRDELLALVSPKRPAWAVVGFLALKKFVPKEDEATRIGEAKLARKCGFRTFDDVPKYVAEVVGHRRYQPDSPSREVPMRAVKGGGVKCLPAPVDLAAAYSAFVAVVEKTATRKPASTPSKPAWGGSQPATVHEAQGAGKGKGKEVSTPTEAEQLAMAMPKPKTKAEDAEQLAQALAASKADEELERASAAAFEESKKLATEGKEKVAKEQAELAQGMAASLEGSFAAAAGASGAGPSTADAGAAPSTADPSGAGTATADPSGAGSAADAAGGAGAAAATPEAAPPASQWDGVPVLDEPTVRRLLNYSGNVPSKRIIDGAPEFVTKFRVATDDGRTLSYAWSKTGKKYVPRTAARRRLAAHGSKRAERDARFIEMKRERELAAAAMEAARPSPPPRPNRFWSPQPHPAHFHPPPMPSPWCTMLPPPHPPHDPSMPPPPPQLQYPRPPPQH